MGRWQELKAWQKKGVMGFIVLGIAHILLVTLDLILEEGRSFTHPLTSLVTEYPLYAIESILYSVFGFISQFRSGTTMWVWIYLGGTIGWGIMGAALGLILGLLSDLTGKLKGRRS